VVSAEKLGASLLIRSAIIYLHALRVVASTRHIPPESTFQLDQMALNEVGASATRRFRLTERIV